MACSNLQQLNVAVIGAGAAGLVATRELLREGHDVTVFEQNGNVGGIWGYQEECESEDLLGRNPKRRHVHSSMYSSLRTNLPRQIMSFSDFPFIPEVMGNKSHDSRRFPSHTEVQAWLEVFTAKFDLRRHIRFNSQITSLRPVSPADSNFSSKHSSPEQPSSADTPASVETAPRWKLKVQKAPPQQATQQDTQRAKHEPHASHSNDATSHSEHGPSASSSITARDGSSAAAASTSHAASSHLVDPDDSIPDQCFSDDFRPRDGSVDQNGAQHHVESAACDCACLSRHARQTSARQTSALSEPSAVSQPSSDGQSEYEFDSVVVCVGNYHQPNLPDIKGIDDFRGLQMHAHNYRSNSMFAGMRVIVVGASFSGEELARAVAEVASHVFHSARSFQKTEPHTSITRTAMLTELSSDSTATLQDGRQIPNIDAVLYCTGYQYAYPFLEGTGLVTSHDMRVDPLWQHIFPPAVAPTLAFVGLIWKSLRNPQFELQSKLIARVLSGRARLPSRVQMAQDVTDFYQVLVDRGVPVRYTHNQTDAMPINQWAYNAQLAQLCGPDVPRQPAWLQDLYAAITVHILGRPDSFRDEWGPKELAVYDLADKHCNQMLQSLV